MTFLPCLRWSRNRWWLPLDTTTGNALAAVLLDLPDSGTRSTHVAAMQERLQCDPALLIYTVLRRAEQQQRLPPDVLSVPRLAHWLVKQSPRLFAEPDRELSAPQVTPDDRLVWQNLARRCQSLPIEDWMTTAPQWLAVHGPRVSPRWQVTWPRLRPPADLVSLDPDTLRYTEGAVPLSRLAAVVRSERQLRGAFDKRLQTEKLASLKQFAYGLTHEINNPLANIVTRSEQLQADESDSKRHDSLQRIISQAMRAHEMISDVMFFAHPPRPKMKALDVGEVIGKLVAGYRERCDCLDIELNIAATSAASADSKATLRCTADADMFHDAIDALLRNAVEAIGSVGRIVINSGRRGSKVWVRVADSGPGLSEEARRHAFDPYYSGREAGRGLGLGLCRVVRIAKLHRGGASLSSGVAGCVAQMWIQDQT